jgi:hypothetical protein
MLPATLWIHSDRLVTEGIATATRTGGEILLGYIRVPFGTIAIQTRS